MPRPTSYNAEPDVDEWVRDYAYSHGMSISRLVNEALRLFKRTRTRRAIELLDRIEKENEEWVGEEQKMEHSGRN